VISGQMEKPLLFSFTSCSFVRGDFQHLHQQVFDRYFATNLFASLSHGVVLAEPGTWVIVQPGRPVKVSPRQIGSMVSSERVE